MTSDEIAQVFYKFLSNNETALSRGMKDRERIRKALENGEQPSGHRVDWIQEAVNAVNDTLIVYCEKFNKQYPADRISTLDLIDVLTSLMAAYKQGSS